MNIKVIYASTGVYKGGSDEWESPDLLFRNLHREFDFTIDMAATELNAKLPRYSSDSLHKPIRLNERVFCNPPYSHISKFLKMAPVADLSVFLIPARVQSRYWLMDIFNNPHCHEIRWLHRGVRFIPPSGVEQARHLNRAPLPCAIVIFRNTPREGEIIQKVSCADTLLTLTVIARGNLKGRISTICPNKLDTVIKMHLDGATLKTIAEKTEIPLATVGRIAIRLRGNSQNTGGK